jgi:diacylglycerol kinase family enzyme
MRRITILANPIAGRGRAHRGAERLRAALVAGGAEVELVLTTRAGHAHDVAQQLTPATCDTVVAVGGDGTVNEVVRGLTSFAITLGVLAQGTGNVLARTLHLPRSPERLAALLLAGTHVEIPVARANGRRFLLFAGAGFDAAMVQELERTRRGASGRSRWAAAMLRVVRRWPRCSIACTTGDGERFDGLSQVLVTRVRDYGGVLQLPASIDVHDGLLHVLVFRQRGRLGFLCATLRAMAGRLRPGRDLELRRTHAVRIDPSIGHPPAPVQLDGDFLGATPVAIDVEPGRVRVHASPRRVR